jgi:hypothetical protein
MILTSLVKKETKYLTQQYHGNSTCNHQEIHAVISEKQQFSESTATHKFVKVFDRPQTTLQQWLI